jgi:predicted Zn finger-like uncharacterized protein
MELESDDGHFLFVVGRSINGGVMIIQCPVCRARYQIDPKGAPKHMARVKCPKCTEVFQITLTEEAGGELPSAPAVAPRVLVVDDSKFFRELILDVLKPLPLTFLTAADGMEALEVIRREQPDLVILDLNLPGKNGYELIREVRAEEALKDIRLLAMSGVYRKETDVTEVRHLGADDFLNKSFKPEQLQERVTALLKR